MMHGFDSREVGFSFISLVEELITTLVRSKFDDGYLCIDKSAMTDAIETHSSKMPISENEILSTRPYIGLVSKIGISMP